MAPKQYKTIYADPPWLETGGGAIKRGADRHYQLMRTSDIMELRIDGRHVSQLAEDNAHLYLWVTNNFLIDGLQVMKAWGFEYKTMITWAKDRIGLGQYFRGQTEHCLFGVRGSLPYKENGTGQLSLDGAEQTKRPTISTLLWSPRYEHSRKPDDMRKIIEKVSYGDYIELFARRTAPGWDVWGNEV